MNSFLSHKPDLLGVATGSLCAIHCTLTPLYFATQPLLHETLEAAGHRGHASGFWGLLDYGFLLLSLLAVWFAARASRRTGTRVWLWAGYGCFAVGLLLESVAPLAWLMYLGTAILVVTHLVNFRQCHPRRTE